MLKQHKGFAFSLPSNKLFPFHLCGERQCRKREHDPLFWTAEKDESSFTSISDAWSRRSEWEVGGGAHLGKPTSLSQPSWEVATVCSVRGSKRICVKAASLTRHFWLCCPSTSCWKIHYLSTRLISFIFNPFQHDFSVNNTLCNPEKPSGYFINCSFITLKNSTLCSTVHLRFCMQLRANSDNFPIHHWLADYHNPNCTYSQRGMRWMSIYTSGHLSLSMV